MTGYTKLVDENYKKELNELKALPKGTKAVILVLCEKQRDEVVDRVAWEYLIRFSGRTDTCARFYYIYTSGPIDETLEAANIISNSTYAPFYILWEVGRKQQRIISGNNIGGHISDFLGIPIVSQ